MKSSKKPKENSLEYWLWEIEYGIEDERKAFIRIGRALHYLRGEKYKKVGHMWRQDKPPGYVTNFDEYCKWKWSWSRKKVEQYILAYEVHRDINEEGAIAPSSQPDSESVLRPLTRLKNKEDRQKAWELASKHKVPGEKVTAKDTATAVEIIKGVGEASLASVKSDTKVIVATDKAERELHELSEHGITTADGYRKIHASWKKMTKNLTEEAKRRLAYLYREFLDSHYPE